MTTLTVYAIDQAVRHFDHTNDQHVETIRKATELQYVVQLSATQVQWTADGIEKANAELPDGRPNIEYTNDIDRAIQVATHFAQANNRAKDAASAIRSVTHFTGNALLNQSDKDVLNQAIAVLEKLQSASDQHSAIKYIKALPAE